MIKAVLFDIGDVIFDESVPHTWLFHAIFLTLRAHGKRLDWDVWNAERRRLAAIGPDPEEAIEFSLRAFCEDPIEGETLWHEARAAYERMRAVRPYGFLLDGMSTVLQDLSADFRLGVVANQHPPVAGALADYGIAQRFEVIVISESVGLYKPNPAIFQYALDRMGLSAEETLFVGDRADNDIRPAKALGMKTVRLRRGLQYSLYNPPGPEMAADETVDDVSQLAVAVRRVASEGGAA
jgi:HAD superfamily hydrolase (TIGR01549 family)